MDTTKIVNYNKIGNSKITPQEQLKLLENVLNFLERYKAEESLPGLCTLIKCELRVDNGFTLYENIPLFIPIFNKENADEYGHAIVSRDKGQYWWKCTANYSPNIPYDSVNRINFIKWMAEVIEFWIETHRYCVTGDSIVVLPNGQCDTAENLYNKQNNTWTQQK